MAEDAPELVAAWLDPEIVRWCRVPSEPSAAVAKAWIDGWAQRVERGVALDLVLAAEGTGHVLGEVGLRRLVWPAARPGPMVLELGWWIAADHRGRGLAGAAVRLLVAWARTSIDARLIARIPSGHPASAKVAADAGMAMVGPLADRTTLWSVGAPNPHR